MQFNDFYKTPMQYTNIQSLNAIIKCFLGCFFGR